MDKNNERRKPERNVYIEHIKKKKKRNEKQT